MFVLMNATTGLVLEGGGMRVVFTIGVLDYLMDADITFPYGIGVSAGAGHGMSFLSRQRGRAKKTAIDMLEKYQYIGLKHLWQNQAIFDQDFLYDRVPNEILPFDYDTAFNNPMRFEIVTTNCRTGYAEYHTECRDRNRLLTLCKASAALPFVAPICPLDGVPMLDGGITDPIPVERAISQGFARNVVVLTHNRGYRDAGRDVRIPKFVYKNYPRLRVALSHLKRVYNAHIELVEQLEAAGQVLVICPEKPLEVDRFGTRIDQLEALYEEGYACAERIFSQPQTQRFLAGE